MLERVEVDGFRSLLLFEASILPGLNIIVGPNGSGKSNFVDFLDFLGEFVSEDLDNAIAVAHGAGSLFSRERSTPKNAYLRFRLCGTVSHELEADSDLAKDTGLSRIDYQYSYRAAVRYDKRTPSIFVSEEEIILSPSGLEPFMVHRRTRQGASGPTISVTSSSRDHPFYRHLYNENKRYRGSRESSLERMFEADLQPTTALVRRMIYYSTLFNGMYSDMTSCRSINIDPAATRRPAPVSSLTGVDRTGENLASALYRLPRGDYYSGYRFYYGGHADPDHQQRLYDSIVNWCRELNPQVTRVAATLDLSEALLKPIMEMDFSTTPFSFFRISDGTVKWVALVTIMFCEKKFCVIEEPENFLHPRMQEGFVNLCREILNEPGSRKQFIISTHSQTLLDMCQPEEIIAFAVDEGRTVARRPSNAENIKILMKESSFGAGYFYKIGALDD